MLHTQFTRDAELDITNYKQIESYITAIGPSGWHAPVGAVEVRERVEKYHHEHVDVLDAYVADVASVWNKKVQHFTAFTNALFRPEDTPTATYTCYPTIWPLVARDPERKTVAFPVEVTPTEASAVLAHEFLHELYYRHIAHSFPHVDINSRAVWDVSEVVNVLIMSSPEWQEVFPYDFAPYEIHKSMHDDLLPVWKARKDFDDFLQKALVE